MIDALYPHRELVCAVSGDIPEDLLNYLKENSAEDLNILVKTASNARELAACAPFTTDYPIPEHGAMFYLCENGACKAPVDSISKLRII